MFPIINYKQAVSSYCQDPAFYTNIGNSETIAEVTHKGRTLYIDRVGEMYLSIPEVPAELDMADPEVYNQDWHETVIRYTDDLESFGIKTDDQLRALDERFSKNGYEIWHNNSWFEVYSDEDDFGYDVHHELNEAIDFAFAAIQDDEYWESGFINEKA
jgi:hypothetical protein